MTWSLRGFAREAATQIAEQQYARAQRYRELEREKAEVENKEPSLQAAALRADKPLPERACPRCWIWDGELVELTPMPSRTDDDLFRCSRCGDEFSVEA